MEIWPAIDIRDGLCVRLSQGDFHRQSTYGDSPLEMARRWLTQGARRFHLVDLNAAVGNGDNRSIIQVMVRALTQIEVSQGSDMSPPGETALCFQVGGGVRSQAVIEQLLAAGVTRLVCGTRAIAEPEWFARMATMFPGRLVLGLDARDGKVAVDGWTQTTTRTLREVVHQFRDLPLAALVYTDISRDGMLDGLNLESLRELVGWTPHPVIASGGVATVEDIRRAAEAGAAGCIVGRALYEGRLTLAEALAAADAANQRIE